MPQKLCTWHRAKASTSRAVQHHTAAAAQGSLVQHHSPQQSSRQLCAGHLCTSMAPSPKALQNQFRAGKSTQKTCGTSGTSHVPNTHPECPRFHNELVAPLKQLCLKLFSTACHHQQRSRFDLKLLHSLGRNLMMQNPALGLSACFSLLNYKCPFAQKHSLPARGTGCVFSAISAASVGAAKNKGDRQCGSCSCYSSPEGYNALATLSAAVSFPP